MTKRKYRLLDVYDYLLKYYNLEWRLYQIKDFDIDHNAQERGFRAWDFDANNSSRLFVVAIVYQNGSRKTVSLSVTNDMLEIYEITPYMHHYKQPEVSWADYLSSIYSQGQNQCDIL